MALSNEEFMARPTEVVRRHLGYVSGEAAEGFEAGRLSMAFECITVIRAIESNLALRSDVNAAIVSVLETLLVDQGLTQAYELYDLLSASRRLTFVREPEPSASVDVAAASSQDQASQSDELASADATPGQMTAPVGRLRELAEVHRSQAQDEVPTDVPSEADEGEDEAESSE
jgi:hypothetical protein